jgi:hypothetical protein
VVVAALAGDAVGAVGDGPDVALLVERCLVGKAFDKVGVALGLDEDLAVGALEVGAERAPDLAGEPVPDDRADPVVGTQPGGSTTPPSSPGHPVHERRPGSVGSAVPPSSGGRPFTLWGRTAPAAKVGQQLVVERGGVGVNTSHRVESLLGLTAGLESLLQALRVPALVGGPHVPVEQAGWAGVPSRPWRVAHSAVVASPAARALAAKVSSARVMATCIS